MSARTGRPDSADAQDGESEHRLHVAHLTGREQCSRFVKGELAGLDLLVFVGVRVAARRSQFFADVERHQLVAESRRREPRPDPAHAAWREADFFLAFALGADFGIFANFQRACRQFPDPLADHVTVLPDQDDAIRSRHRNQHDRSAMPHDLHRRRFAVRQRDVFALEPENAPGKKHFFHS